MAISIKPNKQISDYYWKTAEKAMGTLQEMGAWNMVDHKDIMHAWMSLVEFWPLNASDFQMKQ